MDYKKEIKEIEARILKLELQRGGKLGEMANWIRNKVREKMWISTEDIRAQGEKVGYSWQMLQRAKRELCPDITCGYRNKKFKYVWRIKNVKV